VKEVQNWTNQLSKWTKNKPSKGKALHYSLKLHIKGFYLKTKTKKCMVYKRLAITPKYIAYQALVITIFSYSLLLKNADIDILEDLIIPCM
jgi:hypothetical protein